MSRLFQARAFFNHWLNVVDEHSIHSPFFFDFYMNVVKGHVDVPILKKIEHLRNRLLENNTEIPVADYGAGSKHLPSGRRRLSAIAATSLSPESYCQFYYRVIKHIKAERAVELGTSLGITSLYLAAQRKVKLITFEGSPAVANVALTNFEYFNAQNIELVEGNIDQTLPEFLLNPAKINFAFIDANHRYQPLIKYFTWLARRMADNGIMVIDDIHYTPEMETAWNEVRKNDLVYGSVDLFRCGLLFFDPTVPRHHFVWSLE